MKKIITSRIFAFVLGALIFGGGTVLAYNIFANQIGYSPNWKASNGSDITNVEQALDELYQNTIRISNFQTFNNSSFSSTRNTSNIVSLSNLNKGDYLCTSYYAASSYEESSTRGDISSVAYTINGCSTQTVYNNHGHWNAAKTAVTGSIYTSVMSRGANFYCKIDNDNTTVSVTYSPSSTSNECSVSMQISCTKLR